MSSMRMFKKRKVTREIKPPFNSAGESVPGLSTSGRGRTGGTIEDEAITRFINGDLTPDIICASGASDFGEGDEDVLD